MSLRVLLLFLLPSLVGCVEFNAECSPPIEGPDEVVSHLAEPVPVARTVVRTRESALGNAMGDAYLAALSNFTPRPTVAIENAGAIREFGLCTTRTELARGPLTRLVLRDVVPFSNELVVVELTERALFDVLEHGVSTLASAQNPGGQFLQVAGMSYEVDCTKEPERLVSEGGGIVRERRGERVRAVTIDGRRIERLDASNSATVLVAVNDFIASGGDNFIDFLERTPVATGTFSYAVLEEHLRRLGPSPDERASLEVDPENPRIVLAGCE